ncbi:Uma2 family endonuclease [Otoolea muris]|uniref:Uma2 family endonuclease n=1 Tax=Otoolea muris TaxID=2941515 RepID=UPI00203A6876|nr:Uma2 family endonuclease [Otoolea muris]
MALTQNQIHTVKDIYDLPEGQRAELIDGQIYSMAPPKRIHQRLIHQLDKRIGNYIDTRGGDCEVYPAPFAVFLSADDKNYVEPDISVICDKNKLDEYGCNGAPDWIIEIVSPSTERMDYGIKLFKYCSAGVREYWIINPVNRTVNIYDFQSNEKTGQYSFDNDIRSCIYDDLSIKIADLLL